MQILDTVLEMNHALRVDGDIQPNPAMLNRCRKSATACEA